MKLVFATILTFSLIALLQCDPLPPLLPTTKTPKTYPLFQIRIEEHVRVPKCKHAEQELCFTAKLKFAKAVKKSSSDDPQNFLIEAEKEFNEMKAKCPLL
uniref:Uncharacterized protein n=1 Tax=Panagrolaimus sp. ES5 TaxID=591445 RepID=A0AC34GMD4_9BILA